jgi:hypothetical protein
MDELRRNEGSCPERVTCDCPRPGGTIPLLENKHADLELRNNSDGFELRFLDQPRIGETLVLGYYPGGCPWFVCFSLPTEKDVEELDFLLQDDDWEVTLMSEAWEEILDQQGLDVREGSGSRPRERYDDTATEGQPWTN